LDLAPIVLFMYNRPWHAQQTVEALRKNALAAESDLFVFCDGPKDESQREKVRQVRYYVKAVDGFRRITVVERPENLGLAASIIAGVTQIVNGHGKVIVLEDDIITSPYFLTYMNQALEMYADEERVMSVTGHNFPVWAKLPETFFIYGGASTQGWGTWKRAWAKFNPNASDLLEQLMNHKELIQRFNFGGTYNYLQMLSDNAAGKNDSWGVRWYASVFLQGGYGLWPRWSLVNNIGFDNTGRHCGVTDVFNVSQLADNIRVSRIPIEEYAQARKAISDFYRRLQSGDAGLKHRAQRLVRSCRRHCEKYWGNNSYNSCPRRRSP